MLTSNSKFRWWPGSEGKLTAKRNFKFGVNIFLSQSRWATLYLCRAQELFNFYARERAERGGEGAGGRIRH